MHATNVAEPRQGERGPKSGHCTVGPIQVLDQICVGFCAKKWSRRGPKSVCIFVPKCHRKCVRNFTESVPKLDPIPAPILTRQWPAEGPARRCNVSRVRPLSLLGVAAIPRAGVVVPLVPRLVAGPCALARKMMQFEVMIMGPGAPF